MSQIKDKFEAMRAQEKRDAQARKERTLTLIKTLCEQGDQLGLPRQVTGTDHIDYTSGVGPAAKVQVDQDGWIEIIGQGTSGGRRKVVLTTEDALLALLAIFK